MQRKKEESMAKQIILVTAVLFALLVNLQASDKYAVLIAGQRPEGVPPPDSFCHQDERFLPEVWHDTALMFNMLRSKGYSRENIFV